MPVVVSLLAVVPVGAIPHAHSPTAEENLPRMAVGGSAREVNVTDTSGKPTRIGSHDDTIQGLAIVGKGEAIAALSADGALKLWSVTDKRQIWSVSAHDGGAFALAASPDGKLLATGGADKMIRLWSRAKGTRLAEIKAHNAGVRSLRFTGTSDMLVSGGADKLIRVWRITSVGDAYVLTLKSDLQAHDDPITMLTLSPDDKTIASVSQDGYLKTWQMNEAGGLLHRVRASDHSVLCVAFSPNGQTLATGDEDGRIRLWNAASGTPAMFNIPGERPVYALAFSSDGTTLISGGADKTVRFWNTQSAVPTVKPLSFEGTIRALTLIP